jgi:hypothetical protein
VNDRLRALRVSRTWTQQRAADEARAAYEAATGEDGSGIDGPYIGRLERGKVRWPSDEYRAALRTVFRVASDEELGLVGMRQRTGSPGPAAAVDELEALRAALAGSVREGAMTPSALDELDRSVRRYGQVARHRPAGLLLGDLTADLAEVQTLLDRPRPLSTSMRLTRVVAQMAGLMCLTLIKLDRRRDFRRWAITAREAAGELGDPDTRSWVLAQEAYGHYYSQDLAEALAVCTEAQDVAGAVPRVGAVLAAALESRILAAMGDREGCRRALERAEDGLAALPASAVGEGAFAYDAGQLAFHTGNAYTHLGESAPAWTAQQRALELAAPNDFMDRAFTRLDRSACLLADGELDTGLAYAVETMSALTDDQRAGIITGRGRELLAALAPAQRRALPAAALLRERLMTPDQSEAER